MCLMRLSVVGGSFFDQFAPGRPGFFPLLGRLSRVLLSSSTLLVRVLNRSSPRGETRSCGQVGSLRHRNSGLAGLVLSRLNAAFVAPFSQRSVRSLTSNVSSIVSKVGDYTGHVAVCGPRPVSSGKGRLKRVIRRRTTLVNRTVSRLRTFHGDPSGLHTCYGRLRSVRGQTSSVCRFFVAELFRRRGSYVRLVGVGRVVCRLRGAASTTRRINGVLEDLVIGCTWAGKHVRLLIVVVMLTLVFSCVGNFRSTTGSVTAVISAGILAPFRTIV